MGVGGAASDRICLADGRVFKVNRKRSCGTLDAVELKYCRENGIPLAYDPLQLGWVCRDVEDDIDPFMVKPPEPEPHAAAWHQNPGFRSWRDEDLSTFMELLGNPDVWEMLPEAFPDPLTEDIAHALITISKRQDHHAVYAVTWHGRPVGQIRLEFDRALVRRDEAEISYWFGTSFWGRGIASKTVAAFSELAFRTRPALKKLIARVHPRNQASAMVLTKCGYSLEHRDKDGWQVFSVTACDLVLTPIPKTTALQAALKMTVTAYKDIGGTARLKKNAQFSELSPVSRGPDKKHRDH